MKISKFFKVAVASALLITTMAVPGSIKTVRLTA